MPVRAFLAIGITVTLLVGGAFAVYRNFFQHWFEPSREQLAAEDAGLLVPGQTRILDSLVTPEGVRFQLVTYRTTKHRCLDVVAGTAAEPRGAVGGCGFEDIASRAKEAEMEVSSSGSLGLTEGHFTIAIGFAGPLVRRYRVLYGDETSEIRTVDPELHAWFAVGSPSRSVASWEPE